MNRGGVFIVPGADIVGRAVIKRSMPETTVYLNVFLVAMVRLELKSRFSLVQSGSYIFCFSTSNKWEINKIPN